MLIEISVIPSSPSFLIQKKENIIKVYLTEKAEGNRANLELIKELRSLTGKEVKIISGSKSRRKKIFIDVSESEWEEILSSFNKK
ncbi:MAG: DUF167 domain-containing protein [Candidatus Bilamarchaeaceae archaeon]